MMLAAMHCLDHGEHVDSAWSPGPVPCRGPPGRAQPRAGGWGSKDGRRGGEPKRDRSVENSIACVVFENLFKF